MTHYLQQHIINMLNYSKELVWCVDAVTYDLLYTNDACFAIWGYTPGEMMKDRNIFFSHLHPDDAEICNNGFKQAREKGRSHNEFRVIHKDGSVRTIKGDAIFMKGENGLPDTFTGITRDITKERQLTEQLVLSENKFHSIAEDAPVMMWTSSYDQGVEYVNRQWIEFTGKDISSLKGSNWMSLLHPDDNETLKAKREEFYSSKTPIVIECRFLRKDGVFRNVMVHGSPRFDSTGKCIGFVGTGFDTTEIRSLNEKLLDSELRFKSIANDSPILMWTADAEKKCTFFNNTWTKFSGLAENELLEDKWIGLVHPDDKDILVHARNEHYLSKTPFEIECRLKNMAGKYRWIQIKGSPQFNSMNEFIGFVGNGADITELKNSNKLIDRANKRLRDALRESKRLLHIVNKTNNIIVLTDAAGKITWANRAFTHTTGYTLEEAIGKKPGNLVQGPDTDPATVRLLRDAIEHGETVKAEILNYNKDGRKYWLDVRIEPIYEDDILTGFMAIEMDITQRKSDEKIFAETNKRIKQFSFITSHELRHEFSKIMLLINSSKTLDKSTDDFNFYFTELEVAANNMNAVIRNMNENLLSEKVEDYSRRDIAIGEIEEICLIDDDKLINLIHQRLVKKMLPDVQVKVFEDPDKAMEYFQVQPSLKRLIFLDLNFPQHSGWDFLDRYSEFEMKQPVVILSSSIDSKEREKSWAYKQVIEFIIKPLTLDTLQHFFDNRNKS